MSCFTDSTMAVDGITLLYLLMIFINVVILIFMALTTESFENYIHPPIKYDTLKNWHNYIK